MGISTDGGMIVGAKVSECTFDIPKDYEWCEEQGLDVMNPWYNASFEDCTIGYKIKDVLVFDLEENGWLREAKNKAIKFKSICGVDAKLIGIQDIM
jgi:hypothetical protein